MGTVWVLSGFRPIFKFWSSTKNAKKAKKREQLLFEAKIFTVAIHQRVQYFRGVLGCIWSTLKKFYRTIGRNWKISNFDIFFNICWKLLNMHTKGTKTILAYSRVLLETFCRRNFSGNTFACVFLEKKRRSCLNPQYFKATSLDTKLKLIKSWGW